MGGTPSPLTASPSNVLQTLERQLHRRLPRPLPVELIKAVRASLHRLHVHHHIHGCLEHRQRKAVHSTHAKAMIWRRRAVSWLYFVVRDANCKATPKT